MLNKLFVFRVVDLIVLLIVLAILFLGVGGGVLAAPDAGGLCCY